MNADIQLLSNTLVYNHALSCGNDEVANGVLELAPPARLVSAEAPAWLVHALLPSTTVTFLNTDPMSQAAMENGKRVQAARAGGVLLLLLLLLSALHSLTLLVCIGVTKPFTLLTIFTYCVVYPGRDSQQTRMCNSCEAAVVGCVVSQALASGCAEQDIGIISPYRSQLRLLRGMLDEHNTNVEVCCRCHLRRWGARCSAFVMVFPSHTYSRVPTHANRPRRAHATHMVIALHIVFM